MASLAIHLTRDSGVANMAAMPVIPDLGRLGKFLARLGYTVRLSQKTKQNNNNKKKPQNKDSNSSEFYLYC
jgi:hypothetical protein